MSSPAAKPEAPAAQLERLRRERDEQAVLVQEVRRELIRAQISILELNDTILRKETEKADAVSLLGKFEQALEGKVDHIMELDRVLNERIATLRARLDEQSAAHATVVEDLVRKVDAANREIGATHELAAGYARDLAGARDELQRTTGELAGARRELAALEQARRATEDARAALERELAATRATLSWRLTRPFRRLRELLS